MARRLGNILGLGVSASQTGLAEVQSRCYDRYGDELRRRRIIACLLFGGVSALKRRMITLAGVGGGPY